MTANTKWSWDKESKELSFSVWSVGVYSDNRDMPTYVLRERCGDGMRSRYSASLELLVETAEEVERLRGLERQALEKINSGCDHTIFDVMAERLRFFAEGDQ